MTPSVDLIIFVLLGVALLVGALASLFLILVRITARGEALPLEERRPVPWGGAATAGLIVLSIVITFAAPVIGLQAGVQLPQAPPVNASELERIDSAEPSSKSAILDPEDFSTLLLIDTASKLTFAVVAVALLVFLTGASATDLGFSTKGAHRDLIYGLVAFGAVLLPIIGINVTLNLIFDPQNEHPILAMLKNGTPPTHVWLTSILAAVMVAPVVEEFVFRGIFQGYLEKRFGSESWTPILVSSVCFAAVHYNGDSPAPSPALFVALALCLLYRLTHPLRSCIVLHFCLNAMSIIVMWMLAQHPELTEPATIFSWLR